MKNLWYLAVFLLVIGILAGFSGMQNPTGALIANIPPRWDYATNEFVVQDKLELDLNTAFFDSDSRELAYSVTPSPGITAGIQGSTLIVMPEQSGTIKVTASDGSLLMTKELVIVKQ
ncbi:hypothetical protein COV18_00425 [Candidatus Woesearchaeota archaeon CG10_big_fil_rev_8_21_14_0_10_37_12]|nr:MAG: hypothetical protein COV18_00425 [Candidatus Woesearchaeota archaeon CG10_big_fil_rev_8_21_14_0_10_37_12]